ncbi:hypothetical protein ACEE23_03380 [Corynebacterium sp. 32222D000AT]|uniref:hypothetical protein n=1 Tax=unclassified Corynebacterium TaxID=2624378 RepID=UPI002A9B4E35|nr:hypothetical protein [Mycobacteriaceae bacterium]MDY5828713.1 hypothetical protein [Corynebacterium sp.]
MKKFSRLATAGLAVVSALGLAACHPPHENPSEEKIDNASTFTDRAEPSSSAAESGAGSSASTTAEPSSAQPTLAAAGAPRHLTCESIAVAEPDSIALDCEDTTDSITNIEWTEWDNDSARGTGTRAGGANTEEVEVVLSRPAESPQGLTFTEITVDGEVVGEN